MILARCLPRVSEGSETRFGVRHCMSGPHPMGRLHKRLGWRVGIGAWANPTFEPLQY
jgi:hypothetical protein